jgi:uncharacterized membrane protein
MNEHQFILAMTGVVLTFIALIFISVLIYLANRKDRRL